MRRQKWSKLNWGVFLTTLLGVVGLWLSGAAFLNPAAAKQSTEPTPPRVVTLDDMFAEVARRVPAFGGMFISEEGVMNVYLLDPSSQAAAQEALYEVFGRDRLPQGEMRVLPGKYGFAQLKAWHDRQRGGTLALPGVVRAGIDEGQNRLEIGVRDMAAWNQVEEQLARLSVPREAVNLVQTEPVKLMQGPGATLRQQQRPVVGGLEINSTGGTSTLGAPATAGYDAGFLTCSHCTKTTAKLESSVIDQVARIGVETKDPAFFTGNPCPGGRKCRYSDSAFIKRDSTDDQAVPLTDVAFGFLAKSLFIPPLSPYLIAPPYVDRYEIWTDLKTSLQGEAVAKVGRTTGETAGTIVGTCEDSNPVDANGNDMGYTLLCQDRANMIAAPGDSGAPVFSYHQSPGKVILRGILWGNNGQSFFSSLGHIEDELGNLSFYTNPINTKPDVKITAPKYGFSPAYGPDNTTTFKAQVVDYEGCCAEISWSSDVDGPMGTGAEISYSFSQSGLRYVKVVVKDKPVNGGDEQYDEYVMPVFVVNNAPTAKILQPGPNATLFKDFTYALSGQATDPNETLPDNALSWTVKKNGGASVALGKGSLKDFAFDSLGTWEIKLTATDSQGMPGFTTIYVKVVNPPGGDLNPSLTILNPANNSFLDPKVSVALTAEVKNMVGTIGYIWTLSSPPPAGSAKKINYGFTANGQFTYNWIPLYSLPAQCYSASYQLTVVAIDSTGLKLESSVNVMIGPTTTCEVDKGVVVRP